MIKRLIKINALQIGIIFAFMQVYDLIGFKFDIVTKLLSIAGISLITEALILSLVSSLYKKKVFYRIALKLVSRLLKLCSSIQTNLIKNEFDSDNKSRLLQSRDYTVNANIYIFTLIRCSKKYKIKK